MAAYLCLIALIFVVINLVVDLLYFAVDPRLRFARIAELHPELTAFRRDLHAHPELGFEEVYTAARVAGALKASGVDEVHTGIGKTGVVGVIHGRDNRGTWIRDATGQTQAIGLRADMDALPMTEHNDFAWKSGKAG
jgi:metal-dependent amidase/aminoacylase/carboxypeptidase family protein